MRWAYWMQLYLRTHCVARGLSPLSIAAYEATLEQFRAWIEARSSGSSPDAVTARDVLEYLEHLRRERDNGAAVDREEVGRLLATPQVTTVLGVRDRALLALLYGTGIRASECAGLSEGQVNLPALTVTVRGKGGHDRTVPFNEEVAARLREYVQVRGAALPSAPFFRSRFGKPIGRGTVYERVRTLGRRARLAKPLSPHRLRHTFASHLVGEGVGLVTIRDLLGHRLITSTQIYLHVTAHDLRAAAERHPIARLLGTIEHLLPHVRLPFQRPGARCATA